MMKGTVGVSGLVLAFATAPVMASPITWSFAGSTTGTGIAEIPVGSHIAVDWTFDPSTPSGCAAGDPNGAYFGQSATVTIDSTGGSLVYHAASGFVLVDTNEATGCSPLPAHPGTVEARLYDWSGPDLPGLPLYTLPMPFPGGLFWSQAPSDGAFPGARPATVSWQGPFFGGQAIPVNATLEAVPEPAALGLVLSGLAIIAARRPRRRSRSTRES